MTSWPATTHELEIPGAFKVTSKQMSDPRGYLTTPFHTAAFYTATGIKHHVLQANHSVSCEGVVRGIHFSKRSVRQAKYVYCLAGNVLDVLVDLREGSPAFGTHCMTHLNLHSNTGVFIPADVGHAFLALDPDSVVVYLVSEHYDPGAEATIDPFDHSLQIPWRANFDGQFILSERDRNAPSLAHVRKNNLLHDYFDHSR